ncbi:hypothetical protein ACHAWF_000526, partial [Thalassiosira exigua]
MSSVDKRPDHLQAAGTLRETFDEESQHPGHRRSSDSNDTDSSSATQPQRKGWAGLVFVGMLGLILIIALAVGLTTRGGGDEVAASSTAAAAPETPKEVPSGTITTLSDAPPKVPEGQVATLADEGQVTT